MQGFLLTVYGEALKKGAYFFWQRDFHAPVSRAHWRIPAGVSRRRLPEAEQRGIEFILIEGEIRLK